MKYKIKFFFFCVIMVSSTVFSKHYLKPEYQLKDHYYLKLSNRSYNKNIWYIYISKIIIQLQKKNLKSTLLINSDSNNKSHDVIRAFESILARTCKKEGIRYNKKLINYVYKPEYYSSVWVRNNAMLAIYDEKTNTKSYLVDKSFNISKPYPLQKNYEQLIQLPFNWSGPSDIITDKINGNLYITTRILDMNRHLSKQQIEKILRDTLKFNKLAWLKPSPWESTGDTDTILFFSKPHNTQKIKVFVSHLKAPYARKSVSHKYFSDATDFLNFAYASTKEYDYCKDKAQFKNLIRFYKYSVLALNKWSINLKHNLMDSKLERFIHKHDDFDNNLSEMGQDMNESFNDLEQCLNEFKINMQKIEEGRLNSNIKELMSLGYSKDDIILIENSGIYSVFNGMSAKVSTTVATYINGIVLDDTYLMPSFPSLENLDTIGNRNLSQIESSFEELSNKDVSAQKRLKNHFKNVIPIRSDFLRGGALHCTSYGDCD